MTRVPLFGGLGVGVGVGGRYINEIWTTRRFHCVMKMKTKDAR